jgi:hypothetical protein
MCGSISPFPLGKKAHVGDPDDTLFWVCVFGWPAWVFKGERNMGEDKGIAFYFLTNEIPSS